MLSHSLSFWFSALVPHELDLALESEVQKGCRTSVRSGWSPHAGDVGLMLLFISKFLKTALRWEVAGSLFVCLSVCPVPGKPDQDPHQPLSHLVAKASCSCCQQPHHFLPASSRAMDGHNLALRACAQGIGAVPWGWQSGHGGLHGCPGSAICFPGASHSCFSLEEHEISFSLAENTFSEIF